MKKRQPAARVAPDKQALSYRLREVVAARGLTAYALGRDAGVDPAVVQRFLSGERDVRLETADRLAAALGLRLVETARKSRPAARPPADPDASATP